MALVEKRKLQRTNSLNLLSFICYDENENEMTQGMGKTLNVSEGGIRLETHVRINAGCNLSLTIALGDDLRDFQGKIIYVRDGEEGKFEYGIEFDGINDEERLYLRLYMMILDDQGNED